MLWVGSPTNSSTRSNGRRSSTGSDSQPPGSRKTTTSPRSKSVIFCTTTRSPRSRVFSIDSDGMMNICPTNARSSEDTITAPTTTISSSFRKDSACPPGVRPARSRAADGADFSSVVNSWPRVRR